MPQQPQKQKWLKQPNKGGTQNSQKGIIMTPILIDYDNNAIIVSSSFLKKASVVGSSEYKTLKEVRSSFESFTMIIREFKKNTKQEHYDGLTYEYMRTFIQKYEDKKTVKEVLAEFEKEIDKSRCHSKGKRYPLVKNWFLEHYPEVYTFGKTEEEIALDAARARKKRAEAAIKVQEAERQADVYEEIENNSNVVNFPKASNM